MIELVQKTLIQNGSWQTLLKGLGVTLEISFLSILIGTILGAVLCCWRRSRFRFLSCMSAGVIAVLRGSPVLLLLLLMYYVVFAKTDLPAPLIAVAAFALNFSAHCAEMMRSALEAVDPKQIEAAGTLGFSRWQAFRLIAFPQAIRVARPVYQSNIVYLIQWTSVVGYIAITDLTGVINNIASRTMEPLFMIGVGIILYFGIASLCGGLFAAVGLIAKNRSFVSASDRQNAPDFSSLAQPVFIQQTVSAPSCFSEPVSVLPSEADRDEKRESVQIKSENVLNAARKDQ